ncbi:MAG: DNA/RNA nuclease SfsA [Gammaproteobacteria bacterium]|nr:DNA/RNA nuclease SfsA [Gammaproteobacteria bacterium]MDP2140239.1 DNA/RNA nuclease SfsA [Gammaproteobacteria bacterium]MDP2348114.1 DNA/RNA nuclease SfsA [Gammaproteobacteria bacterium]
MKFSTPLHEAILIKRYKRFLVDVTLPDGSVTTLHCPNTGSMLNCAEPGSRVWYSVAANASRKYPFTWEVVEVDGRHKVGINTGKANALVREALAENVIDTLRGYANIQSEVVYGSERSRVDFLLSGGAADSRDCYVEVKSVTLGLGDGLGAFPDAVTSRGQKHLRELMAVHRAGHRAILLFCVQHSGIERVVPADHIDPKYGAMLRDAHGVGVEVKAYGVEFAVDGMTLRRELPVLLA